MILFSDRERECVGLKRNPCFMARGNAEKVGNAVEKLLHRGPAQFPLVRSSRPLNKVISKAAPSPRSYGTSFITHRLSLWVVAALGLTSGSICDNPSCSTKRRPAQETKAQGWASGNLAYIFNCYVLAGIRAHCLSVPQFLHLCNEAKKASLVIPQGQPCGG